MRRYGDLRYAATELENRGAASSPASRPAPRGRDSRFIVTNLAGLPKALYEKIYCARGQAENLIKAHKLHLASDRTSCTNDTSNQFRLLIPHRCYLLADAEPARLLAPRARSVAKRWLIRSGSA